MELGSSTCINRLNGRVPPPEIEPILPTPEEEKLAVEAATSPKRKTTTTIIVNKDKQTEAEKPPVAVNTEKPHPDLEFVYDTKKLSDKEVHKVITSELMIPLASSCPNSPSL